MVETRIYVASWVTVALQEASSRITTKPIQQEDTALQFSRALSRRQVFEVRGDGSVIVLTTWA